ncbi:MAG: insulinase family protein [Bryobacterales bacterium]|nr:insulinase family protein [Bryobacterales bacterium]
MFGEHPYAVASPEPAHIAMIEREDLSAMLRDGFAPGAAVLVLVGDLPTRTRLEPLLSDVFGSWSHNATAARRESRKLEDRPAPAMPVHVIHRPGSVQAELRMGRPAPHRLHKDYMALSVLNTLFGGGASSRLFTEIREKQGLAYHVSSSFSALVEGGALSITTQVAMDRAGDAVRGLRQEMRRLIREPISTAELQSVRNYMSGVFVLRLESYGSLAGQLSGVELLGLGEDYLGTYAERVAAVTAEKLREVATRYFDPEGYALVAAGDASVLEPQLKEFGAVVVSEAGDSA